MRQVLVGLGGALVGAAALWLSSRSIDLNVLSRALGTADLTMLGLVVVVVFTQVVLRCLRWTLLLPRDRSGRRVSASRLLPVLLIGYLGNVLLPARLGEPIRTYLAAKRESLAVSFVFGTVVLERALDVVTLGAYVVTIAVAFSAPSWIAHAGVAVGGAITVVVASMLVAARTGSFDEPSQQGDWLWLRASLTEKVRVPLQQFVAGAIQHHSLPVLGLVILINLGCWVFDSVSVWLVARSLGIELHFVSAALVGAAGVLSTAIPGGPGYVGTFELATSLAARAVGIDPSNALALALAVHAATFLPVAAAGAVSLALLRPSWKLWIERAPLPVA